MNFNLLCICSGGSAYRFLEKYLEPFGCLNTLILSTSLDIDFINEIKNNIVNDVMNVVFIDNNLNGQSNMKDLCTLLNSYCINNNIKIVALMDKDFSLYVDYFLPKPFMKQEIVDLIDDIKHEEKIQNTLKFYNIINNNIKLMDLPLEPKIKI